MSETITLPYILQIHVEEPTSNPDQPSAHHSLAEDLMTAEKRYRAILQVLIGQLTGLQNTHVRIIVSPAIPEAVDAVSFWLLPLFRGEISKSEGCFRFTPEQHAPEFSIEFTSDNDSCTASFEKVATLSAYCPECSSRWINAAMMQCTEGSTVEGKDYLKIRYQTASSEKTTLVSLPEISTIKTTKDWELVINPDSPVSSPIGPKLRKIYQEL